LSNYEVPQAPNETPREQAGPSFSHIADDSLKNLLRLMSRRRKWIVSAIVASTILAFIVSVVTKPTYEATTTIELNKGGAGMDLGLGDIMSQGLGGAQDALLTDLSTESEILEGNTLAVSVIQRLNLSSQPEYAAKGRAVAKEAAEKGLPLEQATLTRTRLLKIFEKHLKVAPVHGTRLIRITVQNRDPNEAARIANAMIDSYKEQYLKSHFDATSEASDWLTKQLSDLKSNVEESDKKLADFEKETGILTLSLMTPAGGSADNSTSDGGAIHSVVIQKLDALNAELTVAEANRIEKEAIYRLAQADNGDALLALASNPSGGHANSMALSQGGISALQQLRQQQNVLKMSLAQASTKYGANNRHLNEIQDQLNELNGQILQEMQEVTKLAHSDLQIAQQTEDRLRQEFGKQQVEAGKLNEKTVEFAVLSQEAYSRKRLYDDLYTKLQEANVAAGIKATNITIVDPARAQAVPISPKLMANLEAGLALGVFAGLLFAFVVDRLDNRVVAALEVEEITGAPVIGIIPKFGDQSRAESIYAYGARHKRERKSKSKGLKGTSAEGDANSAADVMVLEHPESQAAEAVRSLRTSILLSRPLRGGVSVILITSCIPGEGKSTLSGNLAITFAQQGKKVILIEADMRRPSLKQVLNVDNKTGLSNVLTGTHSLDEAIQRSVLVPTLDVLSSGPHPPLPSELLGSKVFDETMVQLRSLYDIILIDSPPALLLTDAISIAPKTDAIVWVARAETVTRPQLARAAQLIERNQMPVIGFVLNFADWTLDPYGYGYGYENYGSYYEEGNSNDA
jgi:capsular exopolysaccharide synthesis family protein